MSESVTTQKTAEGTVFTVETVSLAASGADQEPREMGVLWIKDANDAPKRFTDFSAMHKSLERDAPVRVVYDEVVETQGEYPKTYMNLVSILQG